MALRIPRITIQADFKDDGSDGELSSASVGYGLHQAWIYATMFGAAGLFGIENPANGTMFSSVYLISLVVNFITLIVCGVTDSRAKGKILQLSEHTSTALLPALLMCAGTFLIMFCDASSSANFPLSVFAGFLTGVGSAFYLLCWGDVFARMNLVSIIFNTIVAFAFATLVYVVLLLFPAPTGGVVAALLPWAEMLLVRMHSPRSYLEKRDLPKFIPLPVNHLRFYVAFSLPMLFFGVALGDMREISMTDVMMRFGEDGQITAIIVAELIAALVLAMGLMAMRDEQVNDFARPVVPLIGVSIAFTLLKGTGSMVPGTVVLAGYIACEGMLWVFFCEYAQRYRLSPVLVFGIGRGTLGIGSFAGLFFKGLFVSAGGVWSQLDSNFAVVALVCMLAGQALTLHRNDIRRIMLHGDVDKDAVLDMLNLGGGEGSATGVTESMLQVSAPQEDDGTALASSAPEAVAVCPGPSRPVQAVEAEPAISAEGGEESEEIRTSLKSQDASTAPASDSGQQAKEETDAHPLSGDVKRPEEQASNAERTSFYRKKCEVVANRYLLSAREAEVLFYLAKGYNSAYLQEKLFIAEGTAKTHIRHIYNKVDVHSQQELMRLVNDIRV